MPPTLLEDRPAQCSPRNAERHARGLPRRLAALPPGDDPLSPQRQTRWILAFLILGLVLRTVRYLLRFPLWEDECLLSANYLDRGYPELLRPLDYYQVCVPGFLWAQLTVVKLFGFTEYALRLVPFAASVASLFLFRRVASRLLRGTALVLAVGFFAVGYPMVRYAAEAKPYGCDLFIALAMLALALEWLYREGGNRRLWVLAAVAGPAVWCSYPAVFIGGGLSLALGHAMWTSGRRGWAPWLLFNLILAGSFLGLLALNHVAVGGATQNRMVGDWENAFPPLAQPVKLAGWFFKIHAGNMLAYPVGDKNGGSTLTLLCCAAGIALLTRRRQGTLLLALLAPAGLNFVAAALHRYPYGGHARMSLYLGPAICILSGLGAAAAIGWLGKGMSRRKSGGMLRESASLSDPQFPIPNPPSTALLPRNRALAVLLTALLALAAAGLLRDLTHPYKSTTTLRARDFARWFWSALAHDSELVCIRTDLKEDVSPGTFDFGWSALYLCNQRIYSPRHARGEPPRMDQVSAQRPLRCVVFRSSTDERDSRPLDLWLARMQSQYQLIGRDRYPFAAYDKWDRQHRTTDHVEVFKFVLKKL